MINEAMEAVVDLNKSPPEVICPYPDCGEKHTGWALKEKIGKIEQCNKCHGLMVLCLPEALRSKN
jgi:hypothetical protein